MGCELEWCGFLGLNGNFDFFWFRRGCWQAAVLHIFKGLDGAVIGALGGGFVAAQEFVDVIAGGFFEGEGEAAVLVHGFEFTVEVIGVDGGDFEVEERDFDGAVAHDLPHVKGDEADEVGFDFVDGGVGGEVGIEVGVVGGVVLGVDGHVGGAEAVDHVGGLGFAFSFGGGGSEGFGAVGAGGGGLGGGAGF